MSMVWFVSGHTPAHAAMTGSARQAMPPLSINTRNVMTLEIAGAEGAGSATAAASMRARDRRAIRLWLYVVTALIVAMVLVGGATRLTDSGLSITEWKPIHGVIPPLTAADWQEEFDKYRQIPEYQVINKGMTLDE